MERCRELEYDAGRFQATIGGKVGACVRELNKEGVAGVSPPPRPVRAEANLESLVGISRTGIKFCAEAAIEKQVRQSTTAATNLGKCERTPPGFGQYLTPPG